jgi:uncharacterized membrane protein YphA (DoxX/SURF4 family)
MKVIANISRIVVGLVFIFSGFVKGVDPLGTAYKIEDYFIAYGWEWAMPFALFISITLCVLEFSLGVAALLNLRMKYISWPLLLIMVYFTVLTFFDAIYEPVPDCGCFGDALKLTNWETFYKNVVLIILVVFIFLYRKNFRSKASLSLQNMVLAMVVVLFAGFSIIQLRHLPMIDFRGWKIGTDLVPEDRGEVKVYLTYRNVNTGETNEYLSPNYPWNDSVWLSEWEFVEQRVDESGLIRGHNLMINGADGDDLTSYYIENPDYQFLLVSYDLHRASEKGFGEASDLAGQLMDAGYSVIVLTGTLMEDVETFRQQYHPELEYYNADDIELKTMIRSNPGLIMLHDGVVIDKWAWRDLPEFQEIKENYLDN